MDRRQLPSPTGSSGYTLIELSVVIAIAATLFAVSGTGFVNWRNTTQHQGSADELISQLRNAAERSVSEGRTYCVDVKANGLSYELFRFACTTNAAVGTKVQGPFRTQTAAVTLVPNVTLPVAPAAAPACLPDSTCLYFYPRGTALPATVVVRSSARTKTYTVKVEGLTARVYK